MEKVLVVVVVVVVCYMTPLNIVFNEENPNGCPARKSTRASLKKKLFQSTYNLQLQEREESKIIER